MSSNNPWVIQSEINRATYQARFWDQPPIYYNGDHDYQFTWTNSSFPSLQDGFVINNQPTGPRVVTPDITGQRFYNPEVGQTVRIVGRAASGPGDVWEVSLENTLQYRPTTVRLSERDLYREWIQL